jgi:hypothetical protein
MATANGDAQQAFAPVLQAINSMRDGHRDEKKAAHEFLEKFQKSVSFIDLSLFPLIPSRLLYSPLVGGSMDSSNRHTAI